MANGHGCCADTKCLQGETPPYQFKSDVVTCDISVFPERRIFVARLTLCCLGCVLSELRYQLGPNRSENKCDQISIGFAPRKFVSW